LTGGTASMTASSSIESWVLAADRPTARGLPRRSTSPWYLLPGLPRSVGLGPVSSPPLGAHAHVTQAPPAGDRAATAELAGGQQPPRNAGAQLVDDPGQRGTVVRTGSAAVAAWRRRQQGLDRLPQLIGDEDIGQWSWPQIMPASSARAKPAKARKRALRSARRRLEVGQECLHPLVDLAAEGPHRLQVIAWDRTASAVDGRRLGAEWDRWGGRLIDALGHLGALVQQLGAEQWTGLPVAGDAQVQPVGAGVVGLVVEPTDPTVTGSRPAAAASWSRRPCGPRPARTP
jgi:hypothetical protein